MSLPWIMHVHVKETDKKNIRLLIPLVLVWLLLFPFLLLAVPIILITAALTWKQGTGRMLLGIFPLLWSVIRALAGLHIQVENPEHQTLISFR